MIGADRFVNSMTEWQQKRHATQRYESGISEIDMWNFDVFLADVIVAGCERMIAKSSTIPGHLSESEWHAILTEIRDGFTLSRKTGEPKPKKKHWKLLRGNFHYLWD
jgi:hypothetical protein